MATIKIEDYVDGLDTATEIADDDNLMLFKASGTVEKAAGTLIYRAGETGASTFNGSAGRVITHSLGHQNYKPVITPTADPSGFLGEVYCIKADDTVTVYNSGSATGAFEYALIVHSA
jgi:hypothetical protein